MRVDAHHHLWRYSAEEYGWIDDSMAGLRRDFLPDDLEAEMGAAGRGAAVAVQARQTLEETEWLLGLAAESRLIRGVVGWAPIAAAEFPEMAAELAGNPLLKGLRHVVQGEAAGFLDGPEFNRGIASLLPTGLVYDVLIVARQATRFVDRHPQQSFVLDHLGKPAIAQDGFAAWEADLRELARRPQVACKISGMVTEADWASWTPDGLKPYFDAALEAFGAERLLFGSDWPVLTVACSYAGWVETVDRWLAPLSCGERTAIEGGNALRIYKLEMEPERG
jgi:L-fuconolactonase